MSKYNQVYNKWHEPCMICPCPNTIGCLQYEIAYRTFVPFSSNMDSMDAYLFSPKVNFTQEHYR